MSPNIRKHTQRERLLNAMLELANSDGYAAASVSKVIERAGVSRPTFYDYFADKDACFVAVHRAGAERLLAQIRDAVAEQPPERAPQAAIRRLIERAEVEPAQAAFLANETMAGGPRALDERDRTIRRIERLIEAARADLPPGTPTPSLSTRALIGATHWLLAPRLRRGEYDLTALADELSDWIESYDQPFGEHRWRTLKLGPQPRPSPHTSELSMPAPAPPPAGGARLPAAERARNQRERILFATAEVAREKGYTAATVADITAAAKLDRRVFYTHFRDKQQAYLAAHELGFQQTMAVGAGAFFSAETWPERVWRGIGAASQFNATRPGIAHIGYVESHAIGAPAIQRIDDTRHAFTIFLQEGNQLATRPQTHTAMEAVAAAISEIGYRQSRAGQTAQLPRLAYHATYLCLAPFIGPAAADDFLDGKVRDAGTGRAGKPASV